MRTRSRSPRRTWTVALLASLSLVTTLIAAPAGAIEPAGGVTGRAAATTATTELVQAAAVEGFNAENIISDALFYDGTAMTAAEIQAFLDAKIGTCSNGKCLNVLTAGISSRGAVVSQTTGNVICESIKGGSMKVSELIYRVQVACGISAKVILATLQKEQGLATSKAPSDWNLKAAMGASCPDTAPCDPAFAGVGPQILKGTQQLKTYKAANFSKQPGRNYIGYHPNSACGGTTLNIRNYATAALYSYTPYQPNTAALAAGFGLGDGCSSYGNRNFYNYYTAWFGSTQADSEASSPVGAIDAVSSGPGEIRVSGWALDPETTTSIPVHVYIDGVGYPTTADKTRPDLVPHYPKNGAEHGYDVTIPAVTWGTSEVCVYGINVGQGANTLLGCRSVASYGGSPRGSVDSLTAGAGSVPVSGWALDPDTADSMSVRVDVGGIQTVLSADALRPDVAAVFPAYGARHGFAGKVRAPAGPQNVCVYGVNVRAGSDALLAPCRRVFVPAASDPGTAPIGVVDSFAVRGDSVVVNGWALDPDVATSIPVHVYVGASGAGFTADATRSDVAAAYPGYGAAHGFSITRTLPAEGAQVCAYAINDGRGSNTLLGCRFLQPDVSATPFGALDSVEVQGDAVTVRGWALDPDTAAPIAVHVYVGSSGVASTADQVRKDVGRVYAGYGDGHGYTVTQKLPPEGAQVCVYAINDASGPAALLGCRAVVPNSTR